MIKLKEMISLAKKKFVDNSMDGLNNDLFRQYIANDEQELKQIVSTGKIVPVKEFVENVEIDPNMLSTKFTFWRSADETVYWILDETKGIQYFFA